MASPATMLKLGSEPSQQSRTKTKRKSRICQEDKENAVPQRLRMVPSLLHQTQGLLDISATPVSLARPFLEATPEASHIHVFKRQAPPSVTMLELPSCKMPEVSSASLDSGEFQTILEAVGSETCAEPSVTSNSEPIVAPLATLPVKGMDKLVDLDLWSDEIPVRNTFIDFASISPTTRRATTRMSGDSEPKNFAPQAFNLQEESAVVISLHESLASTKPQRCKGTERIQLNLNVWIPSSAPKKIGATERPLPLRLADLHFPVSSTAPPASCPVGPKCSPSSALPGTDDASKRCSDPVRRCLF